MGKVHCLLFILVSIDQGLMQITRISPRRTIYVPPQESFAIPTLVSAFSEALSLLSVDSEFGVFTIYVSPQSALTDGIVSQCSCK